MRFLAATMFGVFLLGLTGGALAQPVVGCNQPYFVHLPLDYPGGAGKLNCVSRDDMRLRENGGPGVVDTAEPTISSTILGEVHAATKTVADFGCTTLVQYLTPAGEAMYARLGVPLPEPRVRMTQRCASDRGRR